MDGEQGSATGELRFERFRDEFERCLADVLDTAQSAKENPDAWNEILGAWTGSGPTMFTDTGAGHPSDVREALLRIEKLLGARYDMLAEALEDEAASLETLEDAMWEFKNRRLSDFVKDELAAYQKRMAPAPSISNIFGAAAARQQVKEAQLQPLMAQKSAHAHTCKTCSAPRLKDNLYGNCAFCDTPFFEEK